MYYALAGIVVIGLAVLFSRSRVHCLIGIHDWAVVEQVQYQTAGHITEECQLCRKRRTLTTWFGVVL